MAEIEHTDLGGGTHLFKVGLAKDLDAEAVLDAIGDRLAAVGVRCEGGKLVNACGLDPDCPVSWCMEVQR